MDTGESRKTGGFDECCAIEYRSVGGGSCRACCEIGERHLNSYGIAHGGVIFTLMDCAAGAASAYCGAEARPQVMQCADVHFLRSVKGGCLTALAQVEKSGRKTALVAVKVTDADEKLIAEGLFESFYLD